MIKLYEIALEALCDDPSNSALSIKVSAVPSGNRNSLEIPGET